MTLSKYVYVEPRFQRAIRIDTDLNTLDALTGFVCPKSSADVLEQMAKHIINTGQSAFTWTGPYGSGKSSLIIALAALTSGKESLRTKATEALGEEASSKIKTAFPCKNKGWISVPIVGERAPARQAIGAALLKEGVKLPESPLEWTDDLIVQAALDLANNKQNDGLILLIDEMGKFLESAARDGADLGLFQNLAEAASRSNSKLVVIGVLHQTFGDYANKLSMEVRDEWSKVQGRFIDLVVNTAGEEQIDLLSRAIKSDKKPSKPSAAVQCVTKTISSYKPNVSGALEDLLNNTWPLHPAVAALLGPISKRRFGQNQRSLFGFLNSAEPKGFQEFLNNSTEEELYTLHQLWDYLRINLEPAILASPDGHRWLTAADCVDRCEAQNKPVKLINLIKTVAVLDLFKERSGLYPTEELLLHLFQGSKQEVKSAIEELRDGSYIIYRNHLNSYAVFTGSDFDIDEATHKASQEVNEIDFKLINSLANFQPVLAKRHYFETGAQRWFEIKLTSLQDLSEKSEQPKKQGAIGELILVLPTRNESKSEVNKACKEYSIKVATSKRFTTLVGAPSQAHLIIELARELMVYDLIKNTHPEIQGDQIAQKELRERISETQNQLESTLSQALIGVSWYENGKQHTNQDLINLNKRASEIADKYFKDAPKIQSELLNRHRPSSSAIGGQNSLLKLMIENEQKENLGMEHYSVERGLFEIILKNTGIFGKSGDTYSFKRPQKNDAANLYPLWMAADQLLKKNQDRSISVAEIYSVWDENALGVKQGLLAILSVAYILSNKENLAFYHEGLFIPQLRDIHVEILSKNPADIQVRWMDFSNSSKELLSELANVVRELEPSISLTELAPIDIARALVAIFDKLPQWTLRTQSLSTQAKEVREIFKKAHDPNQLLFTDIPNALKKYAGKKEVSSQEQAIFVRDIFTELLSSYPDLLNKLRDTLLKEIGAPNDSPIALKELNGRAENISNTSGDFKVEAFIGRLKNFTNSIVDIEGLASLAISKSPRDWVDTDLDRTLIEIARLSREFIKSETFAHVHGRNSNKQMLALAVSKRGNTFQAAMEFEISSSEQKQVVEIIDLIKEKVGKKDVSQNVLLATIAELSNELS